VNGQRIIEKRPLFYKNGMVGFYSVGAATFDTFKLTAAENENPGDMQRQGWQAILENFKRYAESQH
jgi:hypothetical protein